MEETWKDIVGYEGLYKISNKGRVLNCGSDKARIATSCKNGDLILKAQTLRGYKRLLLTNGDQRKTFFIHRLVAVAFIPNPENKKTVNHINGIKDDNRVENLEWNTVSENVSHAFHKLGRVSCWKGRTGKLSHCSKKVKCVQTGVVYDSFKEAAEINGFSPLAITDLFRNKRKTAGGYNWELVTENI